MSCSLRRATAYDAEIFVAWRAQASVRRYQPILQLSVAEMASTLGDRAQEELAPTFNGKVQWVILADDIPAGWISLTVVNRSNAIANVGYTISEEFRGHRLAGRGLILASAVAFERTGLAIERIEANCTVTNIASAKTLDYAGYTQEGIARGHLIIDGARVDHYRYGRLATDLFGDPTVGSAARL
ncbi:MAG: GNAT family protein [Thermomicrobiales bacterium]